MNITIYKDIQGCLEISTNDSNTAREFIFRLKNYPTKTMKDLDASYRINIDCGRVNDDFNVVREEWNEDVATITNTIIRDLNLEIEWLKLNG